MTISALPVAKTIQLSEQQQAVLDWAKDIDGSAVIEAVAGSGKTFTLERLAEVIPSSDSAAYAVFNKANADEAKRKMAHIKNLRIGTCHSFGFAAWRSAHRRVQVNAWDKAKMLWDDLDVVEELRPPVRKLVSLAKQSMVGVEWDAASTRTWQKIIDHYGVTWQLDNYTPAVQERLISYSRNCIDFSR